MRLEDTRPIRKLLIENKIQEFGVGSQFRVLYDRIVTPGDGLIIFQGMVDATAELIKSLEGYNIAWVEEAQTLASAVSLCFVLPFELKGLRFGSRGTHAARAMPSISLTGARPENAIVVKANWRETRGFHLCGRGDAIST